MYVLLVVVAAVCCCVLCTRPGGRNWARLLTPQRWRDVGWIAGLLMLALVAIAMAIGSNAWPAMFAAPATVLIILCAPPPARRLAAPLLVLVGVLGLVLALRMQPYGLDGPTRNGAWRASLTLQSAAFVAAGLWLLWRARGGPARGTAARRPRWGLLLPVILAALVLLIDQQPSHRATLIAAAGVALAGIAIMLIADFVLTGLAADLTTAGLFFLGLFGFLDVVAPPTESSPAMAFSAVPGSKPPTGPVYDVFSNRPLVLLAAVQCGAILALGVWLVPRTIGLHGRALLGRENAELAGRVEQLTQTRAEAVDSAAAELRRVERDLHDGAQARLVALGMSLRAAERLIPTSPQAAIALVAEAREASSKALTELRDLVRGVYPPVLADRGLADAVRALALDTPIRTETDIDLPGRLDPPVESACYFAIAEALTNAVKHSGARLVQIRIRYSGRVGMLRIEVTDNGTGGADPAQGSGLAGVERRLGTFDGILAVSSPVGGPTIIVMELPCALSSPRTSSC
jgi:signal transduction histidine kinase